MLRPAGIAIALALSVALSPLALAAPDSLSVIYDAVGRVKQITFANGTTIIYNYDAVGNRTSVVINCSPGGC
ncbi:MAG: RHS repeat protein [Candidatus Obscuribacterales bacterium]|nr:RHS repeat protein [Candidatus Obscuribacterales bacterium]